MAETLSPPRLNIADVARETGLGKDSLRAWERRYGFPNPLRDAQGERLYTPEQVDRLRAIQRLLMAGQRPGQVVGLAPDALQQRLAQLAPGCTVQPAGEDPSALGLALAAVGSDDIAGLRRQLSQASARLGLAPFVTELVAPLALRIGQAWMDGRLRVYQEHLAVELLHNALRQAMRALPEPSASAGPRVLLTTLPGESHGLGLLMAEAMLSLEGGVCINLGVQTPVADIVAACAHYRADIVALSAAGGLPSRILAQGLGHLAEQLPRPIALWLGGHGACFSKSMPDRVVRFADLQSIAGAVAAWRLVTHATSNAA